MVMTDIRHFFVSICTENMPLKHYLIFITIGTFLCWVAWLMVLFFINPVEAGGMAFIVFYLSLFLALTGTLSLIGFFVRVWFSHELVVFRHLGVSSRQAVWLGALVVVTLLLQSQRLLTWWNALLLILFLGIIESLFLSRTEHQRL